MSDVSGLWSNDDIIPICSECKSQQTETYMNRNAFARNGLPTPCQWCGGVVMIAYRKNVDAALAQVDRERNMDHVKNEDSDPEPE